MKIPIVTFILVVTYGLDDDIRMHSGYVPAAAPLEFTERIIEDSFENTELMLVDTNAEQEEADEDRMNA